MSDLTRKIRIERLEKEMAALVKDYEAVSNQYNGELNEANRLRLERQMNDLEKQINEKDEALIKLESADGDINRRHLKLEEKLPEIDYQDIEKIISEVFGERGSYGRAAFFILQKSLSLGGQWGLSRMRSLLQEKAGHFSHYPVGFAPQDRADERDILDRLAAHFKIANRPDDLKLYARNVIRAICDSMQGGSVVFIEVKGWHYINPQDRVLKWLLDDFWVPLAREMPAITRKHRKAKIINVLVTDTCIPQNCLAHYLGVANPFDSEKVVEMPLRKWTKQEIADWLDLYYSSLDAAQIDNLADLIFSSSEEGSPTMVYDALREQFCQ